MANSGPATLERTSSTTINVTILSGDTNFEVTNLSDTTAFNISSGEGAATIITAAGNDIISAGGGADQISAGSGNDFVNAGGGNNVLKGEAGNDYLLSGSGNDIAEGSDGIDLIETGTGNDKADGGAGNDILKGSAGNDTLMGGTGNDRLQGGSGKDSLIGGSGKDQFRFEKAATSKDPKQVDVITDFDPKGEIIEFSRSIFKGQVKPTKGKANKFGCRPLLNEGDFASVQKISQGIGDAKIVYEKSTGLVYFNSKEGPVALVQLSTGLNVTASNFELFY
jgi:Ca2+-binding RTX toxin-like protein